MCHNTFSIHCISHTLLSLFFVTLSAHSPSRDIARINPGLPTVGVAVIGSGPAGLTAGVYAAQSKLRTVIFAGEQPGGQITGASEVENMPGIEKAAGYEIAEILQRQAITFGADILEGTVSELKLDSWPFMLTLTSGDQVQALAVIIATGAAPRKLHVPGELKYWGTGVSACSICDCFMAQGKDVIIIGGGDTAIEHALNLNGYARTITILVRGEKMRASMRMQDKLARYPTVKVLYGMQVDEIVGDGTDVTGVRVHYSPDDSLSDTIEEIIPCGAVFLAIGHNPNSELVAPYLNLSKFGYIHLETRNQETNIPGVFAAGEVTDDRFRQATISAGQGAQAGREAVDFLRDLGVTEEYLNRFRSPTKHQPNNSK